VAVFEAAAQARQRCLEGKGPVFLVCDTFRMSGHAEHDDQRYVEPERLAQWAAKDPLPRFEAWLAAQGWAPDPELSPRLEANLRADSEAALAAPWPDPATLTQGVFSI
jgi:TPP-dependent pyruvate/acetoin dehydrogenase alpha subunit